MTYYSPRSLAHPSYVTMSRFKQTRRQHRTLFRSGSHLQSPQPRVVRHESNNGPCVRWNDEGISAHRIGMSEVHVSLKITRACPH